MLMSPDSSILAFSAASLSRCMAWRSPLRSIPVSFLNSLTKYSDLVVEIVSAEIVVAAGGLNLENAVSQL